MSEEALRIAGAAACAGGMSNLKLTEWQYSLIGQSGISTSTDVQERARMDAIPRTRSTMECICKVPIRENVHDQLEPTAT
jgi:hypothetical protein